MATTFKTFLNNDIASTRTLLHEAIPITGSIVSGTYLEAQTPTNIKNYAHGMFQSVYDYPYLSSSANHIFDITVGISTASVAFTGGADPGTGAGFVSSQFSKKRNIYDQMAQVFVPYSSSGEIQSFDQDGNIAAGGNKITEAIFLNFSRLLQKDEIKKGSFTVQFYTGSQSITGDGRDFLAAEVMTISDYGATSSFKVNSPTGEYGLLYTSSTDINNKSAVGHVYYQGGIAVLTASIFSYDFLNPQEGYGMCAFGAGPDSDYDITSYQTVLSASSIQTFADGVRNRIKNVSFNNTTELNSTIYFCRANVGDFNYSANPTYLSASKIRVKGDLPFAEPVSYITTIGLYSAQNELLAVAKVSEPLKKTPSNELTLRVRLDY